MKRSEMLNRLEKVFNESSSMYSLQEAMNYVLTKLEEAGMSPPLSDIRFRGTKLIREWDAEKPIRMFLFFDSNTNTWVQTLKPEYLSPDFKVIEVQEISK